MEENSQTDKHTRAKKLAALAASADRMAQYNDAYIHYYKLTELLMDMATGTPTSITFHIIQNLMQIVSKVEQDPKTRDTILTKATEYCERATVIQRLSKSTIDPTSNSSKMNHIDYLLERGLEFDEKEKWNEAYDAYIAGCELALSHLDTNPPNRETLAEKISLILGRIEDVKKLLKSHESGKPIPQPTTDDGPHLSESEIQVLKQASVINSKLFLPWIESDATDSFWTPKPFTDPDGFLNPSQEQNAQFGCWKRVTEVLEDPKMVAAISSAAIVQDVVTDCSFVASLCVGAAYERRFKRQLITACIYPQDASGMPLFNPCVVDDYLPISKEGAVLSKWNADIQWKRMLSGFNSGRGLVTLATIDMPDENAKKIGLVPTHAYAGILLTQFKSVTHFIFISWPIESGPAVDAFTLAHNPQYGLEVNAKDDGATMWLLLSKHILKTEENRDYITLHIYAHTDCHRVYYPEMYKVIYVGVYVNSPHILASIQVPQGKSRYTVVVSQHEKTRSLTFSLRAYAKHPFRFGAIGNEYPVEKKLVHVFEKLDSPDGETQPRIWDQTMEMDAGQIFIMIETHCNVTVKLMVLDLDSKAVVCESGDLRPKFAFVETILEKKGRFKVVSTEFGGLGSEVEVSLTAR
ncbi:UNVERIFIED_CONTAM: calpain 7, partial [Siphonaria sp. JEL0065]